MDTNDLFAAALPLSSPWTVTNSRFEGTPKRLVLTVGLESGLHHFDCPECAKSGCSVHDRRERKWRHLNFWQYETELTARVPRVRCADCGIHQVAVPWAREGSGFTLMFEAMALRLVSEMPVSSVAQLMGEHDTRLWRIIHHYVSLAHQKSDWSQLKRISIDETSRKKGHSYVTNFIDSDSRKLLLMTVGKDADCVRAFAEELRKHSAKPEQIEEVAIDMSTAFQKGVREHLPQAQPVFDRFHVMMLAGEALDTVRKELIRESGPLEKGSLWALRGNANRLSTERQALRARLCRQYCELGRAMGLREYLQDLWKYTDRKDAQEHLESWLSWAKRCRIKAFQRLAKTIQKHQDGILNYYENWTTSAAIESVNGRLQLARKRARGYRNPANFRSIAYWIAGELQPATGLPDPTPKPF